MIMLINTFMTLHPLALFSLLGMLSLLVGSFLNVVIYRLPLMIQRDWQAECQRLLQHPLEHMPTPMSLCLPRSHCPSCKHVIPAWHNIPLLSYLLLRGRCGVCRHRISWQYPVVELLCFSLSLFVGYCVGFHMSLLFALIFIWIVLCLSWIDIHHHLLPDSLTLGLLWIGLLANTHTLFTSLPDAVLGAAVAYVSLWLLIQLFYLITGKIGMGHGDFKLFAAFGAWFGWHALLPILLVSSTLGTVIGLIYLKLTGNTRDTPIPFGPFLCTAGGMYLVMSKI